MNSRPSRNVLLQVLWNGIDKAIPNLFLITDRRRYIINCSEGLQRLFIQWKLGFGKLDNFFLTQLQWSHIGGLPGMGMTLRDIKSLVQKEDTTNKTNEATAVKNKGGTAVKSKDNTLENKNEEIKQQQVEDHKVSPVSINVYAPQGMDSIIKATNNFMRFDNSKVDFNVIECLNTENIYSDEELSIHSIPVTGGSGDVQQGPSVCYACHLKSLPGKFFPEKAKALGVPKGPLFSQLTSGKTVTLENGSQVSPEQVMGPSKPSPKFIIIDCPSEKTINNLIDNKILSEHCNNSHFIFHLSKKEICENEKYKIMFNRYKDAKQIFLYELVSTHSPLFGQEEFQHALNTLDNNLFPKLKSQSNCQKRDGNDSTQYLTNFCKINLRQLLDTPNKAFDYNTKPLSTTDWNLEVEKLLKTNLYDNKIFNNTQNEHNQDKILENSLKRKSPNSLLNDGFKRQCRDTENYEYPKIVCLGTGAALPSKLRNVSSTLVFLNSETAVLFDCGEGTVGQLQCHYGDEFYSILRKIKVIFISHMHADHHLGLISIVKQINCLNSNIDDPITIVGPHLLLSWLKDYESVTEEMKIRYIYSRNCKIAKEIGFNLMVEAVPVNHPGLAFGFVVCYDQIKITYSGDTTPCDALIKAGANSTVLIHEATIEDDLPEEALKRNHSTTSQALKVAQDMNAKYTLLTHFSQRYPKMPIIKNTEMMKNTVFAFDHMEISICDIPRFHNILPSLSTLLSEEKDM